MQKRIKERGVPYEVNSKVLTTKYLEDIENTYKLDYLKQISIHSHVLIYDWTQEGDIDTIVQDIELLNFDDYDKKDKKMHDWRFVNVQELRTKRQYYHNRYFLHLDYYRDEYSVPELTYSPEEVEELYTTLRSVRTRIAKVHVFQRDVAKDLKYKLINLIKH